MGEPVTPENNGGTTEQQPLTLQLTKESQLMISKLKELKLDDISAPGMAVFGDNGSQIAILHGSIPVQETLAQGQQAATKEKYLVISPKGFFLAEGRSDVMQNDKTLNSVLNSIRNNGQESTGVSIDERGRLAINTNGEFHKFNLTRIDAKSEEFAQMLKLAIENSRKVAQKPLQEEIAKAKAGNAMLDNMIQQEKPTSSPLPGPTT